MKTLVIFDLEATCWEEENTLGRKDSEIIEIGAVKLDMDTGDIINTFQSFVKPTLHPILSKYCKDLTSIEQEDVDGARPLEDVLPEFNDWVGDSIEYIMSWGYYDKNQIIRECEVKNLVIKTLANKLENKHLNMKNQFAHVYNLKRQGLARALKYLGLSLDGIHHRGIDDALNMAKIYKKVKDGFFNEMYYNVKK